MDPARWYEHDGESPEDQLPGLVRTGLGDPADGTSCSGLVRDYGTALALITISRSGERAGQLFSSVTAATTRTVRSVRVEIAGASGTAVPTGPGGPMVLRIAEDVGWAAAVNRAIASLGVEVGWVAVADPGLEWTPGSLDALLAAAAATPRAGLLGPRLRDSSGVVLPSTGPLPSLRQLLSGRIPADRLAGGRVGRVAGACLLLRRAAWDSVDGVDPRYRDGPLVDVDLGDRLGRAGWTILHVPSAEVTLAGGVGQGLPGTTDRRGVRRYLRDRRPLLGRTLASLRVPRD